MKAPTNMIKTRWTGLFIVLVVFWSIELGIFQHLSVAPSQEIFSLGHSAWTVIRLTFNFCVLGICVLLLPRWIIYSLMGLNILFYIIITTYFESFKEPLMWGILYYQTADLAEVFSLEYLSLIQREYVVLALITCIIKIQIYNSLSEEQKPKLWIRGTLSMVLLVIYTSIVLFLHLPAERNYIKRLHPNLDKFFAPLSRNFITLGNSNVVFRFGYLPSWFLVESLTDQKALLEQALKARTADYSQLTQIEDSLLLPDHIVLIQVESMHGDLLDSKYNNLEITPYLNHLKRRAMFYKVQAAAINGSADADFCILIGAQPVKGIVNYYIRGYPYTNTTPELADKSDYKFLSLMGYNGNLYDQALAFEKIPKLDAYFKDRLKNEFGVSDQGQWSLYDHQLYDVSSSLMSEGKEKQIHLIITYSTHIPFTKIPESTDLLIQNPKNILERYFNSIKYFDTALEKYIESLPDKTLVIIYADHAPPIDVSFDDTGKSSFRGAPVLIYQKGENLSLRQKTPKELAESGQLRFIDVATYFRDALEKNHQNNAVSN